MEDWVSSLPEPYREDLRALYGEMEEQRTLEAKIFKALDKMEALISHNEADISTWLPLEYELNLTYGEAQVQFSEYIEEAAGGNQPGYAGKDKERAENTGVKGGPGMIYSKRALKRKFLHMSSFFKAVLVTGHAAGWQNYHVMCDETYMKHTEGDAAVMRLLLFCGHKIFPSQSYSAPAGNRY